MVLGEDGMSERKFKTLDEANHVARLVRILSGQPVSVVQDGEDTWVVRPEIGQRSIVEVTQALLRQVGK